MVDGLVQIAPDSTGKKVDTSELTVGANTVERQRLVIADDSTAAALAKVANTTPASTAYGLVTRPLLYDANGVAIVQTTSVPTSSVFGDKALVVSTSPNSSYPGAFDSAQSVTISTVGVTATIPIDRAQSARVAFFNNSSYSAVVQIEYSLDGSGSNTWYATKVWNGASGSTSTFSVTPSTSDAFVVHLPPGTTHIRARVNSVAVAGSTSLSFNTSNSPMSLLDRALKGPNVMPTIADQALPVAIAPSTNVLPVIVRNSTLPATYRGRVNTFRTPGRAGTSGQKIFALHNATASTVVVTVNSIMVDLVATVIKAVTVLPPVIRVHRFTAVPTGGTSLTKVAKDTILSSSSSVTAWNDASADGTSSGTALTITIPAGSMLAEEFAPRLITAAGYEMFDRTEFFAETEITLRALEGIVVFLDHTLATQNPTTDMWVVTCDWDEG